MTALAQAPFGRTGSGLRARLRPARIDVVDLREVADAVLPRLAGGRLRIAVLDRPGAGAVVALDEDERRVRVHLGNLAEDMAGAGVPPTAEAMTAALEAWVAARPVPDAGAAGEGIALLDWRDPGRTAVGWRVVVRRRDAVVAWTPSPRCDAAARARTRSAALGRAGALDLQLRVEGPIALWSHPVAVLATAVLADPERLRAGLVGAELTPVEARVVITPGRPVACAGPAVAARLAGQTPENCVTLPWRELAALPWL